MGSKNWMFYSAYAVLVVGAGMALFMSQRPLSATVVTWALFSFNVAAVVFVTPAFLNFIREVKKPADNTQILQELAAIKEQISALTELAEEQEPTEQITMQDILHDTAAPSTPTAKPATVITPTAATPPASIQDVKVTQSFAHPSPAPQPQVIAPTATAQPAHKPEQISLFEQPSQTPVGQPAEPAPILATAQPAASTISTAAPADAVITAIVHVEESDVVCIRGEGGGLNWQEGIPMTDEGSDRWSYRASGLTNPATCRIYLNDEISAFGEDIVLQPGAYMEVSPSFPQVEA